MATSHKPIKEICLDYVAARTGTKPSESSTELYMAASKGLSIQIGLRLAESRGGNTSRSEIEREIEMNSNS